MSFDLFVQRFRDGPDGRVARRRRRPDPGKRQDLDDLVAAGLAERVAKPGPGSLRPAPVTDRHRIRR